MRDAAFLTSASARRDIRVRVVFSRTNKPEPEAEGPQAELLIDGMHCNSCGLLIDDELKDLPGARSAATDVRTGRTHRTQRRPP